MIGNRIRRLMSTTDSIHLHLSERKQPCIFLPISLTLSCVNRYFVQLGGVCLHRNWCKCIYSLQNILPTGNLPSHYYLPFTTIWQHISRFKNISCKFGWDSWVDFALSWGILLKLTGPPYSANHFYTHVNCYNVFIFILGIGILILKMWIYIVKLRWESPNWNISNVFRKASILFLPLGLVAPHYLITVHYVKM